MFGYVSSLAARAKMVYSARSIFRDKKVTRLFFGKNVVAVSNAVRENLESFLGINRNNIAVIYNGTDISPSSRSARDAVRLRFQIQETDRVVSVIGTLTKAKGHRYLIKAIPAVVNVFPNLKVLFVGDGELSDTLKAETRDSGMEATIRFCGSQEDVASFIDISDFTIMPSLWEGLPGGAIESINLGKPVVATAVGGLPEVIEDGVNGLLVPPGNPEALVKAIIQMLSSPDKVQEMGRNGRDICGQKFTLSSMLCQYEKYYEEVVQSKRNIEPV